MNGKCIFSSNQIVQKISFSLCFCLSSSILLLLEDYRKMGASTSHPKIEGFCDPKYDKVKKHLEHMIAKGCDENIQLCVYVGGKCVVDLYGATNDSFDGNKTQVRI